MEVKQEEKMNTLIELENEFKEASQQAQFYMEESFRLSGVARYLYKKMEDMKKKPTQLEVIDPKKETN